MVSDQGFDRAIIWTVSHCAPRPKHKTAIVTLMGVYPLSLLFPVLVSWPERLVALVIASLILNVGGAVPAVTALVPAKVAAGTAPPTLSTRQPSPWFSLRGS